jgi:hypothetical protein
MIRRLFCKLYFGLFLLLARYPKFIKIALLLAIALPFAGLLATKTYQGWDDDPDRGAIAVDHGSADESYQTPEYLSQGWNESDSLWFYNTTQGSGLMPYDFLIALEQPDLEFHKDTHPHFLGRRDQNFPGSNHQSNTFAWELKS